MFPWLVCVLFFKQKTAYDMRISDWSSDVCSSDLAPDARAGTRRRLRRHRRPDAGRAAVHQFPPQPRTRHREQPRQRERRVLCRIDRPDRKSVVSGTSVSGRVVLAARRIINKKIYKRETQTITV